MAPGLRFFLWTWISEKTLLLSSPSLFEKEFVIQVVFVISSGSLLHKAVPKNYVDRILDDLKIDALVTLSEALDIHKRRLIKDQPGRVHIT